MKETKITDKTLARVKEHFSNWIYPEHQAREMRRVAIDFALQKLDKEGNELFNLFMLADILDGQNLLTFNHEPEVEEEPGLQEYIDELKRKIADLENR